MEDGGIRCEGPLGPWSKDSRALWARFWFDVCLKLPKFFVLPFVILFSIRCVLCLQLACPYSPCTHLSLAPAFWTTTLLYLKSYRSGAATWMWNWRKLHTQPWSLFWNRYCVKFFLCEDINSSLVHEHLKKKKQTYHQCLTITRLSCERIRILNPTWGRIAFNAKSKISLEVWGSEERQKAAAVTDHKVCLTKLMRLTTHRSAGDSRSSSSISERASTQYYCLESHNHNVTRTWILASDQGGSPSPACTGYVSFPSPLSSIITNFVP